MTGIVVLLGSLAGCQASEPTLDGRTFQVVVGEQGKVLDTPHTLIFADGKLSSPECAEWGFGPGAVTLTPTEAGIRFVAELPSASEGTLAWTGVVSGQTARGSSLWTKAGQDPIAYRFEPVIPDPP